jgi:hypothetical protein
MKQLKFIEPLPELILSGQKDTTWRINDEKRITVGDEISLCSIAGREFAKARVCWVKEKTFKDLTEEDRRGHETFFSDEEMYQTFSKYYKIKVTPKTKVKVIKFRLLSTQPKQNLKT